MEARAAESPHADLRSPRYRREVAEPLGKAACGRGRPVADAGQAVHADHVSVSLGSRPARGTRPKLHSGGRPVPVLPHAGKAGPEPHGLGFLRVAGRERRHPAWSASSGLDAQQHSDHEAAVPQLGHPLRLVQGGHVLQARLLPVEPVAVPQDVRGRPGVPETVTGELVPEL